MDPILFSDSMRYRNATTYGLSGDGIQFAIEIFCLTFDVRVPIGEQRGQP